jgi:hypothetical protein
MAPGDPQIAGRFGEKYRQHGKPDHGADADARVAAICGRATSEVGADFRVMTGTRVFARAEGDGRNTFGTAPKAFLTFIYKDLKLP